MKPKRPGHDLLSEGSPWYLSVLPPASGVSNFPGFPGVTSAPVAGRRARHQVLLRIG